MFVWSALPGFRVSVGVFLSSFFLSVGAHFQCHKWLEMGPEAACEGRDGTRRVSHECELSSMISFMHLFCKQKKKKLHEYYKEKKGEDRHRTGERERGREKKKACGPNLYCLIVMQMIIKSM